MFVLTYLRFNIFVFVLTCLYCKIICYMTFDCLTATSIYCNFLKHFLNLFLLYPMYNINPILYWYLISLLCLFLFLPFTLLYLIFCVVYEGGPKSNENFSLAVGRTLVPISPARCLHSVSYTHLI